MTTVQFEAFSRVSLSGSMPHRARAAGHQLGFRINPLLYGQPRRTCVERRGVLFIVEAESSNPEQLRSEHVT